MGKKNEKLNDGSTKSEWRDKLNRMSDEDLYQHCEKYIWLSAYAANNPRSDYHFLCDAGYAECTKRSKGDIYERAHKQASGS